MIQQTQYTPTTPRYNFPHPMEDLYLPHRLLELSLRSLRKTRPRQQEYLYSEASSLTPNGNSPSEIAILKLKPDPTKTPIVAMDVSSIKLGETQTGILLGIRGAVVWKPTDHYNYLRLGPFPFHITDRNIDEICGLLRNSNQASCLRGHLLPNIFQVQTKLTTLLERWIQEYVNQTTQDSLILWDGSLTAGTPETPTKAMQQLLREARRRRNTILAFSKITRLLLRGQRITNLGAGQQPPWLLRIENYPVLVGSMHLLGNVHVVKLTAGSCTFRLDIDRELPIENAINATQRLLGNEVLSQSYPEALRLAHILSTFTANEVLGLQRYVVKESNLTIVERPNIRRLLFDRFGKGPEG